MAAVPPTPSPLAAGTSRPPPTPSQLLTHASPCPKNACSAGDRVSSGATVGTPAFLAPEICRGLPYSGQAADVWAAGACLYTMVMGAPPFKADTIIALYEAIVNRPLRLPLPPPPSADVPPSSTVPPGVAAAVLYGSATADNGAASRGTGGGGRGGGGHIGGRGAGGAGGAAAGEWTPLAPGVRDLLEGMMHKDPSKRLILRQAMAHPWVTEGGRRPLPCVEVRAARLNCCCCIGCPRVYAAESAAAVNSLRALLTPTAPQSLVTRTCTMHQNGTCGRQDQHPGLVRAGTTVTEDDAQAAVSHDAVHQVSEPDPPP